MSQTSGYRLVASKEQVLHSLARQHCSIESGIFFVISLRSSLLTAFPRGAVGKIPTDMNN